MRGWLPTGHPAETNSASTTPEGHQQLNPLRTKELVFGDVVANPFVEQIARSYIGVEGGTAGNAGTGYLGAYSGKLQFPSEDQPIHADIGHS
jgi:hypothetical protein